MSMGEKLEIIAENVPKVFEAGKKARDKEWWDTYLAPMKSGKNCNYLFAGPAWNGYNFYPTEDIIPKNNADSLFNRFNWENYSPRIDLAQRLEDCGVTIDLSQAANCSNTFTYAYITRLPSLNLNSLNYSTLSNTFANAKYLVTIDKIIIRNEGTNVFTNTFTGCTALKNIEFTGVIGRSISLSDCPLSVESLKNIITCLKDFSSDTANHYKYTLTVKATAFDELEAEGATAKYNGVACTWAKLIDNKKWNLVKG